jgi:hypothetical protein
MATEKKVTVDGKEINESEMPKDCFMIQGKWYTEKGLPPELASYKRLWEEKRKTTQLGNTDSKKKSAPQAPTSEPNTAPPAANPKS